jgi:hypothetical protein
MLNSFGSWVDSTADGVSRPQFIHQLHSWELRLFPGGEGFYGCGSGCYFVFAQEENVTG